jgi:hypothetical protein
MMKRGNKERGTVERRTQGKEELLCYASCVLIAAVLFFLAACESGDPTSVGGCLGADIVAPTLTQPADGGSVAWNPNLQWSAAKSNEPDLDVEKHVVEIFTGTACVGTPTRPSNDLGATTTSYQISDYLDPTTTYAWHVEATFKSTTDQTTCTKTSECRIFTTIASPP